MDSRHLQMRNAGNLCPSANAITLLRDVDGDGVADFRSEFLSGLQQPFGMLLLDDFLYVANTNAVLRFAYRTGDVTLQG
jgi:glucose/arabinose dehydrogenase